MGVELATFIPRLDVEFGEVAGTHYLDIEISFQERNTSDYAIRDDTSIIPRFCACKERERERNQRLPDASDNQAAHTMRPLPSRIIRYKNKE
jgi:hypothetical protein